MSTAVQEPVSDDSKAAAQSEDLNAELVTSMSSSFLKRIGHNESIKPKRVSVEADTYTVELELKHFTATVKLDAITRQIREYDVQPKSEETSSMLGMKNVLTTLVISLVGSAGLYFALKILGF